MDVDSAPVEQIEVKPNLTHPPEEEMNVDLEDADVNNSGDISEETADTSQPSTSLNISTTAILTKLPKQKRGRPKKNTESYVMYNEDGTSNCMGCNQNIPEEMWEKHNALNHYNMAWRYGEVPLDLGDNSVLFKCLNGLKNFDSKRRIVCKKCDFPSTVARDFVQHWESCNNIVDISGMVTCAVCNEEFPNNKFNGHKIRVHNNLAWRIGDPPLDINDQRLVLLVLKKLHKIKKVLHCEQCGVQKKSVYGLLSHQMVCQKSELEVESLKIECSVCGSKILPASYDYHMRCHSGPSKEKTDTEVSLIDVKTKRNAARKALDIIDANISDEFQYYIAYLNFDEPSVLNMLKSELETSEYFSCKYKNCDYTTTTQSTNLENIVEHLRTCGKKPDAPQYYICKMCTAIRQNEQEIMKHIKERHEINDSADFEEFDYSMYAHQELEDKEIETNPRNVSVSKKVKQDDDDSKIKPACISKIRRTADTLFSYAFKWYSSFVSENFSNGELFESLNNVESCQILEDTLLEYYFPKQLNSCSVLFKLLTRNSRIIEEVTSKQMRLFEVQNYNGTYTIFCGGPILSLAWMPNTDNQILAVSIINEMDNKYPLDHTFEESTIIQFWDFGELKNKVKVQNEPSLIFGMAVDFGPVWHLEWCPSGCYNPEKNRLGLLAMAGSDSFVYIFAVPKINENERGMFIKNKPVVVLKLQESENDYYATRISWSKAAEHKYISVGYSNGMVAIYNLENLREPTRKISTQILCPAKCFQAHLSAVVALKLNHLKGGNRWLFTGSYDKETAVWDLNSFTKIMSCKKGIVTDGIWMTNWLNCLVAYDESCAFANVNMTCQAVRDFLSESTNLTSTSTTISAVAASDWLNLVIQGNSFGELLALPLHQMLYAFSWDKTSRHQKCVLGFTALEKSKKLEPAGTCLYNEVENNFNLAFFDYKMESFKDFPRNPEEIKAVENNLSLYPLQKINKIACNPNCHASLFFAVGYQAGFVRVSGMRFLTNDAQVR